MRSNLQHQQLEVGLRRDIAALNAPLPLDSDTAPDTGDILTSLGINYIDNSDKDFSKDAYLNSTPAGGDIADECYNFFRQRFVRITDGELTAASTNLHSPSSPFKSSYTYPMLFFALSAGTDEKALVGTLTRVDDDNATLDAASVGTLTNAIVFFGEAYAETSANALKSSTHSLFAANEGANTSIARWDEAAGQSENGGDGVDNFDLSVPLPFNLATRGLEFFFSVNAKLRSGAVCPNPVILYVGIYDTTAGSEKFLEADNFALTVNYIGTAGVDDYDCVVVGTFSNGEQVVSNVVTVNNVGVLDADNYLDWNWENAPRILDFALYRRDANTGDIVRVFTIYNGETRFFDKNVLGENPVLTFPTAPVRREYAYAESIPFIPSTDYRRVPITFRVPPTYLQSDTTGRQILRIGIYNDVANDVRPVVLDRLMLSLSPSLWNRSPRDLERIASTTPTSGNPDGNQGGGSCFTAWNPVLVKERPDDEWKQVPISEVKKGMWIFNGRESDRVVGVREGLSKRTFETTLSNGIRFECTASEKFITSVSDRLGTRFDRLSLGDNIQTVVDGMVNEGKIIRIVPKVYEKPQKVYTLSLENAKIFLVGAYRPIWWKNPLKWINRKFRKVKAGAKAHNNKPIDYIV